MKKFSVIVTLLALMFFPACNNEAEKPKQTGATNVNYALDQSEVTLKVKAQ